MDIQQTFDITTGTTLQEAGQKMSESFSEHVAKGSEVVSVSHAYGPLDGEEKWTIMVLYRRVES